MTLAIFQNPPANSLNTSFVVEISSFSEVHSPDTLFDAPASFPLVLMSLGVMP